MGNPKHRPTKEYRKLVEQLSSIGVPQEQICTLIGKKGISVPTLYLYYRLELDRGKAKASAKVGARLFDKAVKEGDTAAMIWWTKSQMRWSDRKDISVRTDEESTINVTIGGKRLGYDDT